MNIAPSLQRYLAAQDVDYEVIAHSRTQSSSGTAHAAHVPGLRLAKAVVVKDKSGYVVAVLAASHLVDMPQLGSALGRDALELASEDELKALFADCAPGAVPPLGAVYGLPMVVEETLAAQSDVFFEAGDHEHLIHVTREGFMRLTADAPLAHFGEPAATGGGPWMQ